MLATQGGLSVINRNEVLNFSKSIGLGSLALNRILKVGDDFWLGGDNGITIINHESLTERPPPKLVVDQDGPLFKFNSISFEDAELASSYRVNEEDWLPIEASTTSLDFSEFAYGDYQIEFRTRKSNSQWVLSPTFSFTRIAPWYKRWWALLCFFMLALGGVLAIFYGRLKLVSNKNRILQEEMERRILAEKELGQVRNNIAQDFHDDLGNKLASISLLSDVLLRKVDTKEIKILQTIKNDADYLYKGTKDFIFSLQDKSNYLDEITIYLADFAEVYLHQFGIFFEVSSDVKPLIKLPYYWSKQIIYIFKEAITNTAKHSNAKNVQLSFTIEAHSLKITCEDDGIGFQCDKTHKNGLENMEIRASKIGCKVDCYSQVGKGTRVVFSGKLPQ